MKYSQNFFFLSSNLQFFYVPISIFLFCFIFYSFPLVDAEKWKCRSLFYSSFFWGVLSVQRTIILPFIIQRQIAAELVGFSRFTELIFCFNLALQVLTLQPYSGCYSGVPLLSSSYLTNSLELFFGSSQCNGGAFVVSTSCSFLYTEGGNISAILLSQLPPGQYVTISYYSVNDSMCANQNLPFPNSQYPVLAYNFPSGFCISSGGNATTTFTAVNSTAIELQSGMNCVPVNTGVLPTGCYNATNGTAWIGYNNIISFHSTSIGSFD